MAANEDGDLFGQSAATGDFNGDGFDDLIVGAPGESPGPDPQSGAAFVFDGSSAGLTTGRLLTQTDAQGINEADDRFGWSFAVGDFNGDGFEDVAVGGPGESPGSDPKSGAVFIFMGAPSGLTNGKWMTQEDARGTNKTGDLFGQALAAGDFNNDGFDDLVVGEPGHDGASGQGHFFPGSSSGLNEGVSFTQTDFGGVNEPGDQFGHSLATGDFNGPQTLAGGSNEAGDLFGSSVMTGDFDNDGVDDMVVGAPGESPGPDPQSGAVFLFEATH